jgi:hypothetical protein
MRPKPPASKLAVLKLAGGAGSGSVPKRKVASCPDPTSLFTRSSTVW